MGEPAVSPTYCPINGVYTFSYSSSDPGRSGRSGRSGRCSAGESEFADCPYGFGFHLKFRECNFGSMDMAFHCLGDWPGPAEGQRYVALMDTQAADKAGGPATRPRYRCALYHEDDATGEISLALSADSTCTSRLHSPIDGFETLSMTPRPLPAWPARLQYRAVPGAAGGACQLPAWAQGKWQHLHVSEGTLILRDQRQFKTYTARCAGQQRQRHPERFLIYARSQCGEEQYKCVWLKSRGNNALEFQIGE